MELQAVELGHPPSGFGYGTPPVLARHAARSAAGAAGAAQRGTDDVVHSAGRKISTREVRLTKSYSKVKP